VQKALAIFSGVLAAAAILAAPAHPEPGRHERGGGEARAGYGGGGGGGPQGRGEGGFRYAPPGVYAGERRDYRYAAPPPAYQQGYAAPQRRPNSLGSEWREQQEEARSGVRQGQMAPLGSVISGIGHHSRGRPLDAGIEYQGARAVYRVRWLMNNGRRVDYIVDAATGRILSEH
jgi:hypothetical protein